MTISKRHHAASCQHTLLDPCALGRPFHLLEAFNQRLGHQLERHLATRFNHRHGAALVVKHVGIGSYVADHRDAAWRAYSTPGGSLAIRMDRCLLLAMLGYHYGDKGAMKVDAAVPETETEQRFGVATRLALLEVLRSCVMPVAEGGLTPTPQRTPGIGDRVIRVEIEESRLALSGILEIALDDASLGLIFASASPRRAAAAPVAKTETPLAERLPVAMSARMLTKEVFLDDVMRLQTGDVMPVRLPDTAEVFVGDTLLFQAAVAEHGGSLCLTSFENAE